MFGVVFALLVSAVLHTVHPSAFQLFISLHAMTFYGQPTFHFTL